MDVEKPSQLADKIAAAKERREKIQKERDAARSEAVNRMELSERRRSDMLAKRDASIEAKKESSLTRHEAAQLRRESQQRQKREKILNDVEKSDARSREVKRRNRWSWGGNIHGKVNHAVNRRRSCSLVFYTNTFSHFEG
jgi:hypothetical protein